MANNNRRKMRTKSIDFLNANAYDENAMIKEEGIINAEF